jgi:hypothetical protein
MLNCRGLAVFFVVCLTCQCFLFGAGPVTFDKAGSQIGDKAKDAHSDMLLSCAKACADCQQACDACSAHCVAMLAEGKTQHTKTLQLCNDCAAMCAVSAQIVARHGPLTNVVCNACADACNQCATACEASKEDAHMRHCAEECRRCEKACRTMTGQAKEHGEPAPAGK